MDVLTGQAEDTQKEGYVTAEAEIGVTQLQARRSHHQRLGEGKDPTSLRGRAPRPRLAGLPAAEPGEKGLPPPETQCSLTAPHNGSQGRTKRRVLSLRDVPTWPPPPPRTS